MHPSAQISACYILCHIKTQWITKVKLNSELQNGKRLTARRENQQNCMLENLVAMQLILLRRKECICWSKY